MSTRRCLPLMLPGITHPFGWLSQISGYVSDTLLTRPPLVPIARNPYDLHVLATPPAFRLSQDQTLQLNFLARIVPDAERHLFWRLARTNTFTIRVYPRNRVRPPRKPDRLPWLLLPACRLGHAGQSARVTPENPATSRWAPVALFAEIARLKLPSGCPDSRVGIGATQN